MKRLILLICILFFAKDVFANCVAEIKDVIQDATRGSIIVETEYALNGRVVQQGRTRYLETSGTNAEIIAKAKADIAIHCENLIRRIPINSEYLQAEKLKRQKELTAPIIISIKGSLIGYETTKTEATDTFKDKNIKVTYDSKNTISAVIAVVE